MTSANTSIERPRLNEFRADFTKLWTNFYVRKLTRTLFKRLPNRNRDFLKLKSLWLKALCFIPLSLLAVVTPARLAGSPSYGFKPSAESRDQFQKRFSTSLGMLQI